MRRLKAATTRKKKIEQMANKAANFLRAVRGEIGKITWPNRAEIVKSTVIVLIVVIFFGLMIGGVDIGIFQILRFFLKIG